MKDPHSPNSPQSTRARINEQDVLALRIKGLSFPAIAAELSASVGGVHAALERALAKTVEQIAERAGEYRALELERFETISEKLWPACIAGDLQAIDRYIRLHDRMAKLLGIDLKEDVTIQTGPQVVLASFPWERSPETIDGTVAEVTSIEAPTEEET